jgi:hypothetical protein
LPADQKVELARRSLETYPGLAALYLHLGRNLEAAGRRDEAEAAYREGLTGAGEPDVRTRLLVQLGNRVPAGPERDGLLREARPRSTIRRTRASWVSGSSSRISSSTPLVQLPAVARPAAPIVRTTATPRHGTPSNRGTPGARRALDHSQMSGLTEPLRAFVSQATPAGLPPTGAAASGSCPTSLSDRRPRRR